MHFQQKTTLIVLALTLSSPAKAVDKNSFLADPINSMIKLVSAYKGSPTKTMEIVENILGLTCTSQTTAEATCTPISNRSGNTVESLWFVANKVERVRVNYIDGYCLRLADYRKLLPISSKPGALPIPGLPVPGIARTQVRTPYLEPPYFYQNDGKEYVISVRTKLGIDSLGSSKDDDCAEHVEITHWPK